MVALVVAEPIVALLGVAVAVVVVVVVYVVVAVAMVMVAVRSWRKHPVQHSLTWKPVQH